MNEFTNFPNFQKYQGQNILSVDYGAKVVGLATFKPGSDPMVLGAGRIINTSKNFFLDSLKKIVDDEFIEVMVVGVSYYQDGNESEKTKEQKALIQELATIFPDIPVIEQDETLSTYAAEERMKSSPLYNFKVDLKKIDEVSAIIILEDFIRKL